MGGYKGVLVSKKGMKNGVKVRVRPSMKKFEMSPEDKTVDLEVIRMATYSPGYLNKQIISILWANGVDDTIFIQMQRKYVRQILDYYDTGNRSLTEKNLSHLATSIKFISRKLYKVHNQGLDISNDPFIKPLIKLISYNKFTELRKRFRVYDPKC